MKKRVWTDKQITETIRRGKPFSAQNKVNPSNKATRYENNNTKKSLVVDRKTREVIHLGGRDFKY